MQFWQQNMTYKQLQELQRQQQLQQLGEARQHNSLNQQSAESQLPLLINGTPVRDAPQMLMNLMQRGSSPSQQGHPNRQAIPQDQNQTMHRVPLQLHPSLHGTPVGSAGGNGSQYSNLKGMYGVSSDNVNMSDRGFLSRQGFQMKNVFGQVPLPRENFLQMNSSLPEFNGRQDMGDDSEIMHESATQLGSSQSLVPLDPLEQKILYNMDDNGWDSSFGKSLDMGDGGLGSTLEQSDFSSALQSGSWSALMQSAVGEASNSDTGIQEKCSGLTFQNREQSTNNEASNFMNEERQQTGWAGNNLQSASSNSKSLPMFNDSNMKSNFPGFRQSEFQSSTQHCDSNPQRSNQISQQIEPLKHSEKAWAGQHYAHSESDAQQQRMASHSNIGQQFWKQKDNVDGTMHKERDLWTGRLEQFSHTNDPMIKDSVTSEAQLADERRSSIQTVGSSYEGANSKSFKNFNDSYHSRGPSGPKQGLNGQFNTFGSISKNAMNLDKGCSPNHQGNSKAFDESSASTTFGRPVGSDSHDGSLQTSENMLDLLHKVDQLREDSPKAHFGSTDHNSFSQMPKANTHADQFNKSSASHGFGLKLAPPSQQGPNSNHFHPAQDSPQIANNINPRQVNAETSFKNQGWLPPNEFSQREHWDDKSTNIGQRNDTSYMNMNVSSDATLESSSSDGRNQPQLQRIPNAWKNVPTSRFPSEVSPMNPSKNSIEDTLWSSKGLNDQSTQKGIVVSANLGVSSMDSKGSEYGEEQPGEQRSRYEISSEIQGSLQSGGLSGDQETTMKHIPAHSNQKDPGSFPGVNGSAVSERNLESFGRSLGASQILDQSYTLLHQMQTMNNSREMDPSKRAVKRYDEADDTNVQQVNESVSEHEWEFRNHMHIGLNPLRPNSSPSGDSKMSSFLSNSGEKLGDKSLSQPASHPSQGIGKFNQNGQILLTYDASSAKTAQEQFSFGKPYQSMPINSSMDQFGPAISRQVGSILQSPTASIVASENFPVPCVLPSDLANSEANIRIKRRKTMKSEIIPWHVEVAQGSHRLHDMSMEVAEQDWACSTNHLVEKVEDDMELIGEGQQMHYRSRRRLIRTMQLIQQLLRSAPASILQGDASSRCDSVVYFLAKLALGDACSLTNCSRDELHAASDNRDMTSEKYKAFESHKRLINVMEGFAERAKKLENDFSRFESLSILDIRLEYQVLERNSVMNRFAKFHMRGQADTMKPAPQRYVTAFPMPRDLPEGAQCYSM